MSLLQTTCMKMSKSAFRYNDDNSKRILERLYQNILRMYLHPEVYNDLIFIEKKSEEFRERINFFIECGFLNLFETIKSVIKTFLLYYIVFLCSNILKDPWSSYLKIRNREIENMNFNIYLFHINESEEIIRTRVRLLIEGRRHDLVKNILQNWFMFQDAKSSSELKCYAITNAFMSGEIGVLNEYVC